MTGRKEFAPDSPLEGDGFELPVPRTTPGFWPISTRTTRRDSARDSSEAAAADSRFAEIFLASALPNQDPDAFPSCTVVIERFGRLERHP
jgi:hypothetical protein